MDACPIDLVPVTDAAWWERGLARAPTSLWQQSWAYGSAARQYGRTVDRFEIRVEGAQIGLVQTIGRLAFGGRVGLRHALGGPVWRPAAPPFARAQALRALKRQLGGPGRLLLVTPDRCDQEEGMLERAGLRRVMTGYTTARLEVATDPDRQCAGLRKSWRYVLRHPPRDLEPRVIAAGSDPCALDAALAEVERTRRARGYGAVALPIVRRAARDGKALLALGSVGDTVEAVMLIVRHGSAATYQSGWSSREGRRLRAHEHLLWSALGALRQQGVRMLDLGGLDVPAGIRAFKLATGAVPVTLPGTYL